MKTSSEKPHADEKWNISEEAMEAFEKESWRNSGGVAWRDPEVKSVCWYGVLMKDKSAIEESVRQGLTLPSSEGYAAKMADGTLIAVGDVISFDGIESYGATAGVVIRADAHACTMILHRHQFLMMRVLYKWGVRRLGRDWFDDLPHTHVAEDDAIEQGCTIINVIRLRRGLEPIKGFQDDRL